MKPPARISLALSSSLRQLARPTLVTPAAAARVAAIHSNTPQPANVVPVYGTGPPPEPPVPAAEQVDSRVARRRRQAEMLRQVKDIRAAASKAAGVKAGSKSGLLKKRFWQDVHVKEVDGESLPASSSPPPLFGLFPWTQILIPTTISGAYEVHLDTRPIRRPNKEIIRVPLSKPHLAHALAIEWDYLTSAQQSTKQHLVPLTSLVCRALDLAEEVDADGPIRASITTTLLRHFDTDCLLCLAPAASASDPTSPAAALDAHGRSLRDVQERALRRIGSYLCARVWPGVDEVEPVIDGESIMPRPQRPGVREAVGAWIAGLEAWELAGLERATLAGKGLLGASRLLVEWSEGPAGAAGARAGSGGGSVLGEVGEEGEGRFGVEEAADAASIEVDWQIRRWGEVEDTHDVEREDIRRQLGSVVLLVSGTGSAKPRL